MAFELFPDELRPSGGNFIREVLFSSIHLGKRVCKWRCNFFLSFLLLFFFFSFFILTRLIRLSSIYSPTAEHPLNFGTETRGWRNIGVAPGDVEPIVISFFKNESRMHALFRESVFWKMRIATLRQGSDL